MDLKKAASDFQIVENNVLNVRINNGIFLHREKKENLKRSFDVDYNIAHISKSDNEWWGILEVMFNITASTLESNKGVLDFSISINGLFKAPDTMPEQQFVAMLELNGLTALYGVSRSIITAISSIALDEERIILPMLNIRQIVELKHRELKNRQEK